MNFKPTVSKSVALEIDNLKARQITIQKVAIDFCKGHLGGRIIAELSFDELMGAMINGYKTEDEQETSEFFYCYSTNLHDHLRKNGQRYICAAINENTTRKFWQYRRTDTFNRLLADYTNSGYEIRKGGREND